MYFNKLRKEREKKNKIKNEYQVWVIKDDSFPLSSTSKVFFPSIKRYDSSVTFQE